MNEKRDKLEAWKYLVDDFLEMACFLEETQRGFLIEKMALSGAEAGSISTHPAFSVSGKLVAVAGPEKIGELWLYDPERKKLAVFKLAETLIGK